DDAGGAGELAARLDELNQERRAIEARMQQEALGAVRALSDPQPGAPQRSGVCLFDASWHQGVVGLVAGRVAQRLRRPVIAFAVADESTLRGSARSVAGIHIRDVLALVAARHPDLIHRFGGHAMAAGLTLERARLDRFARAFDEEVGRWSAGAGARDAIETDGELAPEEIARDTAQALPDGGPLKLRAAARQDPRRSVLASSMRQHARTAAASGFLDMEVNQLKRQLKDLGERTTSLRGFL